MTLVLASAGGAVAVLLSDGGDGSGASVNRTKLDAVPVTRADLVDRQNVDGKLGYAGTYSVNAAAPGPDKENTSTGGSNGNNGSSGGSGNKPQTGGSPGPSQGSGGSPPQGPNSGSGGGSNSGPGGGSATGGAGSGGGQGGSPPDTGNNAGPGTITWLPSVGDRLSQGDRVYGRDGTKVPLFYGGTPFWRALYVGVEKGV
ncbi:hypothetical protein ABZ374_48250, partial [Embleya sp. NPDC005971]